MIGYIEGRLLKKEDDRILLLANQVGYEILLPTLVMNRLVNQEPGITLSLYIYYHQTERQPKPILIGFNDDIEKDFFQFLILVEDIGPLKAVKALDIPIHQIAKAIEDDDITTLTRLKGIGKRTAQKMVATLQGKMERFLIHELQVNIPILSTQEHLIETVMHVLVQQFGHKTTEAKEMIVKALKRNLAISTPEELFDEIYRGEG
ncbi:MAG: Holliday junction DNA helicase RuvA [Desulfobacterales bacterium]|nr:Holliday junction DNA helicase RuvA [Desulfobacterales bacterium]